MRCMTLWLWPRSGSRDATWVVIPYTKLNWIRLTVPELGQLQFSIDRQRKVPIFSFFLGGKGGQISNFIILTLKSTTLARTTYNDVLRVGCVQRCDLWPRWRSQNKGPKLSCVNWLFSQTTHVDVAPQMLRARSCTGSSYIFQVSWKSVHESRSCGRSKIALSHWQGPWLIQQLVLTYKPWKVI